MPPLLLGTETTSGRSQLHWLLSHKFPPSQRSFDERVRLPLYIETRSGSLSITNAPTAPKVEVRNDRDRVKGQCTRGQLRWMWANSNKSRLCMHIQLAWTTWSTLSCSFILFKTLYTPPVEQTSLHLTGLHNSINSATFYQIRADAWELNSILGVGGIEAWEWLAPVPSYLGEFKIGATSTLIVSAGTFLF